MPVFTVPYVDLKVWLRSETTAMSATAMQASMSPYSTMVAPRRRRQFRRACAEPLLPVFIVHPHTLGQNSSP